MKTKIPFFPVAVMLLVISCSSTSNTEEGPELSLAATSSALSLTPTHEVDGIPDLTTTPPTLSRPTPGPTPSGCTEGFVVFAAVSSVQDERGGIYLACTDGTFFQQILSFADLPLDQMSITDIELSPDGRALAISTGDLGTGLQGAIYFVELKDYGVVDTFPADLAILGIDWSPSGDYIGYIASGRSGIRRQSRIDILHLSSRTVSQLVDDSAINSEQEVTFTNFEWAPNGNQVLYTTLFGDLPQEFLGFVGEVGCDSVTHECLIANQQAMDWLSDSLHHLSWSHGSTILDLNPDGSRSTLGIRTLEGEIIGVINLDDLREGYQFNYADYALSPNSERVAFTAVSSDGVSNLFVVRLTDMSLIGLTEDIDWFAGMQFAGARWIP